MLHRHVGVLDVVVKPAIAKLAVNVSAVQTGLLLPTGI